MRRQKLWKANQRTVSPTSKLSSRRVSSWVRREIKNLYKSIKEREVRALGEVQAVLAIAENCEKRPRLSQNNFVKKLDTVNTWQNLKRAPPTMKKTKVEKQKSKTWYFCCASFSQRIRNNKALSSHLHFFSSSWKSDHFFICWPRLAVIFLPISWKKQVTLTTAYTTHIKQQCQIPMCCHVCRQASWHGSEFAAITHILRLGEDREKELTTCHLPII